MDPISLRVRYQTKSSVRGLAFKISLEFVSIVVSFPVFVQVHRLVVNTTQNFGVRFETFWLAL